MSNNFFEKIQTSFNEKKKCSAEKFLLKKIKNGLKNNEFMMYLQFIVDAKTNKFASAEALSTWKISDSEVIMPGKYIGLMEKSGLIVSFDYYMLEAVCRKLAEWKNTDFDGCSISCNVTRITISDKDFADKIKALSEKYDFDRSRLIIEITEDSVERNHDVSKSNIHAVKELGFRIALDDIGSGYTSLISLCEYPTDILKIDRGILLLAETEKGRKMFCGVVELAHKLDIEVVCEGAETEAQNALAIESGCDYIQGWYYTKALSVCEAEEFARVYMNRLA